MRFIKSSIGQTVTLTFLVMAVCLTVLLMATSNRIVETLDQSFRNNAIQLTSLMAAQINTGTRLKRGAMVEPQILSLIDNPENHAAAVRVTHVEGAEVATIVSSDFADQTLPPFQDASFEEETTSSLSKDFLTIRTPVKLGSGADEILVGELVIVWDKAYLLSLAENVTGTLRSAFIVTIAVLILITAANLYLVIGRPLAQTVKALTAVSRGEHDVTLPRSRTTEVRQIVETIRVFLSMSNERGVLLENLTKVMDAAQNGDFSVRMKISGKADDPGNALPLMLNRLLNTVELGINETADALEGLSQKNLSVQMRGDFQGSFERLSLDMNRTATILNRTVSSILQSATEVQSSAGQLSSSSEDLSRRTQHNAATLEEISAAISLVSEALSTAAEIAESAKYVSEQARNQAVSGRDVVDGLVKKMNSIHANSENISEIVKLIDDVAFQTNLLALNAGVEAARAGEHGLGFAVVASEVRSLAHRTTESAASIKTLVTASAAEISSGVNQAGIAGDSIEEIVGSISDLGEQISSISEKAADQAISVEEIRAAVSELDRTTQQNAQLVEDTSQLAHELRNGSAHMSEMLSSFRTRPENTDVTARAA